MEANFTATEQYQETVKSHGRIHHRTVSIGPTCEGLTDWPSVRTVVRIESQRNVLKGGKYIVNKPFVRFFITSLNESAAELAARIRAYWHCESFRQTWSKLARLIARKQPKGLFHLPSGSLSHSEEKN